MSRSGVPEIFPVKTDAEIADLARLAEEIWREYFPGLIGAEQVEFMLRKFLSAEALTAAIRSDGYEYYTVSDGGAIGFIGVRGEGQRLFLSKFYLGANARGHGDAAKMMDFVVRRAVRAGAKEIFLTCNKHNTHSLDVYRHYGFVATDSAETAIGSGYVMDDFILTRTL